MKARPIHLIGAVTLAMGAVGLLLDTMSANAASLAASSVTWTDNFSTTSFDSRWSWVREAPTHWSLTARPGFLRLTTQQTFSNVNNLLVQNAPVGDYEIQSRVVFTPTEDFQIAGLLVYQDDLNSLTLGRAFCDVPPPTCVNNGICFDRVEGGSFVGSNYAMTTTVQGDAYLRLTRRGTVYTGYVSTDGTNWTLVGVHTVTITPTEIGLKASNQIQGATEISADFDFFTLIDNSNRLFLPLILK
jgi:beta-xylosidase